MIDAFGVQILCKPWARITHNVPVDNCEGFVDAVKEYGEMNKALRIIENDMRLRKMDTNDSRNAGHHLC